MTHRGPWIPNHFSESLETIFWVKILKFFDADPGSENLFDPGSGMGKNRIRDKHPGSARYFMFIALDALDYLDPDTEKIIILASEFNKKHSSRT
jgi:hypothetical protein